MTGLLLLLAAAIALPSIAKLAWTVVEMLAKLVAAGVVIGLMLFMLVAVVTHGRLI